MCRPIFLAHVGVSLSTILPVQALIANLEAAVTGRFHEASLPNQAKKEEQLRCGVPPPDSVFERGYSTQPTPDSGGSGGSPEPQNASFVSCDSGSEVFETPHDRQPSSSGTKRSICLSMARPFKEKRKRCRVTPEQLVELERLFLVDRSPTAARRREIGQLLGMEERQTQIWFQNR